MISRYIRVCIKSMVVGTLCMSFLSFRPFHESDSPLLDRFSTAIVYQFSSVSILSNGTLAIQIPNPGHLLILKIMVQTKNQQFSTNSQRNMQSITFLLDNHL